MAFDLDPAYKQVPERIADLKAKHPEATLQPADPLNPFTIVTIGGREFVVYTAACYRTPDDPRPGIGIAWEPFPGTTPYTKNSEMMNAETSAWGRAIVAALASESKAIASAEDVRNRVAEQGSRQRKAPAASAPPASTTTRRPPAAPAPATNGGPVCATCSQPLGGEAARKVGGKFVHVSCSPVSADPPSAGAGPSPSGAPAGDTGGASGGGVPSATGAPSNGPSPKQLGLIHGTLKKLGVPEDDKHRFCSALIDLPEQMESLSDLNGRQTRALIDALLAEETGVSA